MRSASDETVPWVPVTKEEKEKVRQQMRRLLETSHFKNSRRYPALLRFIVEETLEGRGEFLKERWLGVRVFDRPADYDTAADPIVRVTIAEIRKRIAQYYHEEAHESEMRIELMPGRYEPEFRPRKELAADPHLAPEASRVEDLSNAVEEASSKHKIDESVFYSRAQHGWRWMLAVAAVLALVLAAGAWRWSHPSALNELWDPMLAAHRPILICLPAGAGDQRNVVNAPVDAQSRMATPESLKMSVRAGHPPTFQDHEALGENVVFSDVLATMKITDLMAIRKNEYRLRLNVLTTLDDLRHGPTILIGGLDNQWTMRALAPLRYHFLGSNAEKYWIADSQNPQNHEWALDTKLQYAEVNHDYAVIARIHNEETGEVELVVAGIGMTGTAAAGEFIVDPDRVEELRRRIGAGFQNRDFETVLSTDVVNGIAGSPKILAVTVW